MAERPFLGKGLPDSERDELIRSGVFDGDLIQAVNSKDWRRKYTPAEVERMKLLETQAIGEDWAYQGNLWNFYTFLRNRAVDKYWDRQFRTGENLTDVGGTVGYALALLFDSDPDKGSDIGATIGGAASAWGSGPRFSPSGPTYQRNQPAETVGGRGSIGPTNPGFVVTPPPPSSTAKNAPPPPSVPVSTGRPQASERANQRPVSPMPGSRDVANKIEGPAIPRSNATKVPVSPRTGEPDPLGVKKPAAPAAPQAAQPSQSEAPPPKPRRINVRDLPPTKPNGSKTQPQKDTGGSKEETKPVATPAKPQATKSSSKVKRTERIPSPREFEKGTIEAIDRDVQRLPTGSQVISRGENFNTIFKRLKALREAAPNSPNLKALDGLNPAVLEDNAWQFMDRQESAGRPELKDSYTRLYNLGEWRAKRGDTALKDELAKFMVSGRLGARKPDSVVLVDEGTALNFVHTDPNLKELPAALMVHNFKSLFYREGNSALLGNNPNVKVEAWEHNTKLGIHREAQPFKKVP